MTIEPMVAERAAPVPRRLALPVILAAQLVVPLSISGSAVALPEIGRHLGASTGPLQWVVNGFNVAFAVFTLVWGGVADRVGHHRTFRAGITIAGAGSLMSALSTHLVMLDVARVLTGIGAAAVLTGASALISGGWHGAQRTRAFALFGTANGLGLALGPTVAGVLVQLAGWRTAFALPTVVLVAALACSWALPAVGGETTTRSRQSRPRRPPILDLRLLTRPGFAAMVLVPVAAATGFVTLLTYLPSALTAVRGWNPGQAGTMMLVATAPVVIAPMIVGRLLTRTRLTPGHVLVVAQVCLVIGPLVLLALSPTSSLVPVVVGMLLIGLGFGLPLGFVDGEALAQVPPETAGRAAGLLNFFRVGSEAVVVAAYATILSGLIRTALPGDPVGAATVAAGGAGAPAVYVDAFRTVAVIIAACTTVLGVLILLLRRAGSRGRMDP
jgi:predicted MFS family arabinose efflux permease